MNFEIGDGYNVCSAFGRDVANGSAGAVIEAPRRVLDGLSLTALILNSIDFQRPI